MPRSSDPYTVANKTPWQALWDRNLRSLVTVAGGGLSPLRTLFDDVAEGQPLITLSQLKVPLLLSCLHGVKRTPYDLFSVP